MKEESKYYQPEIEEFHVGFEYERLIDNVSLLSDPPQDKWEKHTVGMCTINGKETWTLGNDISTTRVKHLDREDIESCDWKLIGDKRDSILEFSNRSLGIHLLHNTLTNFCIIIRKFMNDRLEFIFQGTIKNKSELKRILKQLGI